MVKLSVRVRMQPICTTSAKRLRRWSNIVQMLYKCFAFAGNTHGNQGLYHVYVNLSIII